VVTNPFRAVARDVRGSDWIAQAARSSLRAAEAKFYPEPSEPLLRVDLRGSRTIGAFDTATVILAIQSATAKLARVMQDPSQERTQSRKADRDAALLIPRAQLGRTLFFAFPSSETEIDQTMFPELPNVSLSEAAAIELCSVLPSTEDDDAALDALASQRTTVRSAVSDIVDAVNDIATGIALDVTVAGQDPVHSEVTVDQAGVLADTLKETRTDRRTEEMVGRLDGIRTRRRIFYLELETGEEISGAVGPDPALMARIRENLDRSVIAQVESQRVETLAGRRGRPTYRLIGLERRQDLFD
jgi:hypothetical protein